MIITRIVGGLGNQLYQYAAGRRLAHRHRVPLKLDVRVFQTYRVHPYSLHHFALPAAVATADELRPYRRTLAGRVSRRLQQFLPIARRRWVVEPHVHFAPEILHAGPRVYLEGHWQSERYFADVADLLRAEIRVATPARGLDAELARRIDGCAAVAVHVRRGDYLATPTHGLCSMDYYAEAMRRVRAAEPRACFFVFSDDPAWVTEAFAGAPDVTVVGHNREERNYEDFRLMTRCRHHVIANSTFSWWAAWLAAHPGQVVIAPRRWFAIDAIDARDIVPATWLRL